MTTTRDHVIDADTLPTRRRYVIDWSETMAWEVDGDAERLRNIDTCCSVVDGPLDPDRVQRLVEEASTKGYDAAACLARLMLLAPGEFRPVTG
jgi:hypothetical protein